MGIIGFFKRLGLKSILASALALEQEIFDLYAELKKEIAERDVPDSLARIIDEELGHQRLIRDLIAGCGAPQRLDRILEGRSPHFHHPDRVAALDPERYGAIFEPLEKILAKEQEVLALFSALRRKSRIPFVRRAFAFLQEQEQVHVQLLEKLLGRQER